MKEKEKNNKKKIDAPYLLQVHACSWQIALDFCKVHGALSHSIRRQMNACEMSFWGFEILSACGSVSILPENEKKWKDKILRLWITAQFSI